MVVGLLTLMMPLLLGYLAGPIGAAHPNITGDHANSTNITNFTCNGCHDQINKLPNNATYPNAHRRHTVSPFLEFYGTTPADNAVLKGCGRCHEESVYDGNVYYGAGIAPGYAGLGSGLEGDLSYTDNDSPSTTDSARAARKQVKPDVCESCHGQFNSGAHGGATLATLSGNCYAGTCHSSGPTGGDPAVVHNTPGDDYVDQYWVTSGTYCGRCHGEFAWYQTTETSAALP
jgi:cytochrome c553